MLLAAACICLVLYGCEQRNIDLDMPAGSTETLRTQTQCADQWGYGSTSDSTILRLKSYLLQKGIVSTRIELVSTGEQVQCNACTCSRGFTFHVFADKRYLSALAAEGFSSR